MSTTSRIVAGIVVAVFVLAVAVLEMVSERVRVEPGVPEPSPAYLADSEIREEPGSSFTEPRDTERVIVLRNGRLTELGPEP